MVKSWQPGSRRENKEAKENEKEEEDVGDFISKEKLNRDDKTY